ncbi:MAG: DUF72 domain-containing protein [Acidothermaceae bacterium]
MSLRIGTCGWQYDDWRDAFYPHDLAKTKWLQAYAESFDTVECDNAFYRLPTRETFAKWAAAVPDGFTMAVKASRFLTHVKRLKDPGEPVKRLLEALGGLGDRLGPVLLQLPPTMKADFERLDECLRQFPRNIKVAVEPRHDTWWTDDLRRVLERHRAALTWSDRLGKPVAPLWRTTSWGYLRLHQGREDFPPDYTTRQLRNWVQRIDQMWTADETTFVYLNNDPGAAAIRNALTLQHMKSS